MKTCPGITLIELLVLVFLSAIAIALFLPMIGPSKEARRRAQCTNNLRILAVAANGYAQTHGTFPAGHHQSSFPAAPQTRGISLFISLLPFIDRQHLFDAWNFDDPLASASAPSTLAAIVVNTYICPSDSLEHPVNTVGTRHYALTSYGGNGGTRSFPPGAERADGIFFATGPAYPGRKPAAPADVLDGASNTLLFGERAHLDPDYDSFRRPGWSYRRMAEWGWWASVGNLAVGDVLLSSESRINQPFPFSFAERPTEVPDRAAFAPYEARRVSQYGSLHPAGANVAQANGSVRFLKVTISPRLLQALSTRAGGEDLQSIAP